MKSIIAFSILAISLTAFAQTANEKYFTIEKSQVKEIATEKLDQRFLSALDQNCDQNQPLAGPFDEIEGALDQIINIGKKIWNIVEAGKPVMNFKTDIATAMPKGVKCWMDLSGWQVPVSKTYQVAMQNGFGMNVVNFQYRVIYVYGGGVEGKGQFIGYATMQPVNIAVAWGFKFDANGTVPAVFNTGTRTEPIGGMQMTMNYKVESPLKVIQSSQAYFINGKGEFKQLD